MVVSWTPLFVLFDLGLATASHKALSQIATLPFPAAANEKNPCLKRRPNWKVFPAFTRSSSRASSALQACPFADGIGKRPVDDTGRVEGLLGQPRAEIEIDGLLLIRDDTVIDRRDPDLRPGQPIERHRCGNIHELAPGLGIATHVPGGPCPRCRQTAHEVLKLGTLVPDGGRRRDLKTQA